MATSETLLKMFLQLNYRNFQWHMSTLPCRTNYTANFYCHLKSDFFTYSVATVCLDFTMF